MQIIGQGGYPIKHSSRGIEFRSLKLYQLVNQAIFLILQKD